MLRPVVVSMLLFLGMPAFAAEPVALVTELSGSGKVGERGKPSTLELLQDLVPGTRLTLAGGARAVIVHIASGVVYEAFGPGNFRVQVKSIEAESNARLTRRNVPPEILAYRLNPSVAAQASVIMRGTARLEGPQGGVLDAGELRYRINGVLRETQIDVVDEKGTHIVHLDGEPGDVFELGDRYAWSPGEQYTLQVTGKDAKDRPVALKARFQVVPAETGARLRALEPAAASPATDWILYALALESVGANATARPIWRRIETRR